MQQRSLTKYGIVLLALLGLSLSAGQAVAQDITERASIYGTVEQDPGMLTIMPLPIEGAMVAAIALDGPRNDSLEPFIGIEDLSVVPERELVAFTDKEGKYVIEGAIAGQEYLVTASKSGYRSQRKYHTADNDRCMDETSRCYNPLDFLLVKLPDNEEGTILGTVYEAQKDGSSDYQIQPLPGATVTIRPDNLDLLHNGDDITGWKVPDVITVTTDENGRYSCSGLLLGLPMLSLPANRAISHRPKDWSCARIKQWWTSD